MSNPPNIPEPYKLPMEKIEYLEKALDRLRIALDAGSRSVIYFSTVTANDKTVAYALKAKRERVIELQNDILGTIIFAGASEGADTDAFLDAQRRFWAIDNPPIPIVDTAIMPRPKFDPTSLPGNKRHRRRWNAPGGLK